MVSDFEEENKNGTNPTTEKSLPIVSVKMEPVETIDNTPSDTSAPVLNSPIYVCSS